MVTVLESSDFWLGVEAMVAGKTGLIDSGSRESRGEMRRRVGVLSSERVLSTSIPGLFFLV